MTSATTTQTPALLVGEAHHRFANSLQVIVSATNVILRAGGCNPQASQQLLALQQRVALLAEVSRSLCGPYGPASIAPDALELLCRSLAASFDRNEVRTQISTHGQVEASETCRTLLLLVSELAMNAMKHGHRDNALLISIDIKVESNRCCLTVRSNTARPLRVARPRMAEELAKSVNGTIDVAVEGTEYRVTVFVPRQDSNKTFASIDSARADTQLNSGCTVHEKISESVILP